MREKRLKTGLLSMTTETNRLLMLKRQSAAAILGLRDVKKDEKGKERKPSRRRNKRGARSTSRKAQSAEDVASKETTSSSHG